MRRTHWFVGLLLLTLVALFFQRMAFTNLILARGDAFLYFYPYWQAAAEALRAGRLPLWNPNLFMGAPLLANSQVGTFYPLNWPLWALLPTPFAVKATVVGHVALAAGGAYLAGRRALGLGIGGGVVTAVLFALGGYFTAQVEHVNQLQGLAWLPWYFVVLPTLLPANGARPDGRAVARAVLGLSLLFALQLSAGHTQTMFISGVTVVVWLGTLLWRQRAWRMTSRVLTTLIFGGLLALMLTAVQLLPTLELSQLSNRQGGLTVNEVLSFSLHPLLLSRAFLPVYGQTLFTEYLAVLPVSAYILAMVGAWRWRQQTVVAAALTLVVVGFFLALGAFNPANWLLAQLPGFDLFRAPARWLAMMMLGVAFLAGIGWQQVWSHRHNLKKLNRPLAFAGLLLLLLVGWGLMAPTLTDWLPTGPEAPVAPLPWLSPLLWLLESLLFLGILWQAGARGWLGKAEWLAPAGMLVLLVGTLFAATRTHPYHNLTTPEAYFDLRPSVTRLLAANMGRVPPDRFMSLSNIQFDPGDQVEIDAIYADQLSAAARYDYTVAIKLKEIVAPNLPLTYGLPAVDGFDGGVLPLRLYGELMGLVLPEGQVTTDGRLRELLDLAPAGRWLDLFNAGYLITDKTGDRWHEIRPGFSAYFDYQLPVIVAPAQLLSVESVDFAATAVYLVADDGSGRVALDGEPLPPPEPVGPTLWRVALPASVGELVEIGLEARAAPWHVTAVTLVDEEEETFLALALGAMRMIHSGDVKIYHKPDVLPRAYLPVQWQWTADGEAALAVMADPTFDPHQTAVVVAAASQEPSDIQPPAAMEMEAAEIVRYAPEEVVVAVPPQPTTRLLLLADAHYPGWRAYVNGREMPIYTANHLFRGVFLPAGATEVVFRFESRTVRLGGFLSLLGLGLLVLLAGWVWRRDRRGN